MKVYSLISAGYPRLSAGQGEVIYTRLEPYGSIRTFEQLVAAAKARKLQALFRDPDTTTVPESVHYHLKHFIKDRIVSVVEDGTA